MEFIYNNLRDNIEDYVNISESTFKQALEDIKILTIPPYDVNRVALHIIVTWHDLFESIDRDSDNIKEIEFIIDNANNWFINCINESWNLESAIEDALIEITDTPKIWKKLLNCGFTLLDPYFQDKYPESKEYVKQLYTEVYDKLANKISDLSK